MESMGFVADVFVDWYFLEGSRRRRKKTSGVAKVDPIFYGKKMAEIRQKLSLLADIATENQGLEDEFPLGAQGKPLVSWRVVYPIDVTDIKKTVTGWQ